jgi:hypothetical protein
VTPFGLVQVPVEDDTESDDTTSSVLTWRRKTTVGEVQVFEPRGESSLSTALPDMVQSLGEKDSSLSKVMVIEMLGIITRDVGPSRNRIHAFETYTKAKPGAELDPMPGSS